MCGRSAPRRSSASKRPWNAWTRGPTASAPVAAVIPAARLRLLPEATLCVHCQQETEREFAQEEGGLAWEGDVPPLPSEDAAAHRTIRATVGSRL